MDGEEWDSFGGLSGDLKEVLVRGYRGDVRGII